MGIYDGKGSAQIGFGFDFAWKKFRYPVLGLAAIIVFALVVFAIFLAVQPRPLEAALEPNPLDLAKGMDSFLTVTVNNTGNETASNVIVLVEAEASDAITVFPKSRTIETLGRGESRTLSPFVVSPNPGVYSGTYILTISTAINGQEFEKQVVLELKAI